MNRSLICCVLLTTGLIASLPRAMAQGDLDQLVVINPGIWHVWFDEQPSQAIVDHFSEDHSTGNRQPQEARVVQSLTVVRDPSTGKYREKPVWLLNFHWDRMITGAMERGTPVYVTVEPGISMYQAQKRLHSRDLTPEQVRWLEQHSFSGGTLGAKENHQRIIYVHLGVIDLHPDAEVATFIHSQSGPNLVAALKSTDPKTRKKVVESLGTIVYFDPAYTAPLAQFVAQNIPFNERLYEAKTGHPLELAVKQLTRTDPREWDGMHYLDWVNAPDQETDELLADVATIYLRSEGTVSAADVKQWAQRVGAEAIFGPSEVGALAGEAGTTNVSTRSGTPVLDRSGNPVGGQPWAKRIKNHNYPEINDIALRLMLDPGASEVARDAVQLNPAYASQYFQNLTTLKPVAGFEPGLDDVGGASTRLRQVENVPVWDGATGSAEHIAAEAVNAITGSGRRTVVIDSSGQDQLAQQVAQLIHSGGYTVLGGAGLDNAVSQAVAGEKMNAAVLKLAGDPAGEGEASAEGAKETLPSQELETIPHSVIHFRTNSRDFLRTKQDLDDHLRSKVEAEKDKPQVGVSIRPTEPDEADPGSGEGWSIQRDGDSNWHNVRHESWSHSELVYDGNYSPKPVERVPAAIVNAHRIVDAVKEKLAELDAGGDDKAQNGQWGKGKKVVVGGDQEDPCVKKVVAELTEAGCEVIRRDCTGMSREEAMRAVAKKKREVGVDVAVAIVYAPRDKDNDENPDKDNGWRMWRLLVPVPDTKYRPPAKNKEPIPEEEEDKVVVRRPPDRVPVPVAVGLAADPNSPVSQRLAAIAQGLRQKERQPHILDTARALRRTEENPPQLSVSLEAFWVEQSSLLAGLTDFEQQYDYLRRSILSRRASIARSPDVAQVRSQLSRWQQSHLHLYRELVGAIDRMDLRLQPPDIAEELQRVQAEHERLQDLFKQIVADDHPSAQLPDLTDLVQQLQWRHHLLQQSQSRNIERLNLYIQRSVLNRQLEQTQQQMATAHQGLAQTPLSVTSVPLSGSMDALGAQMTRLQNELDMQSVIDRPWALPNQMHGLQRELATVEDALRKEQLGSRSASLGDLVERLQRETFRTQGLFERIRITNDPVALQNRLDTFQQHLDDTRQLLGQATADVRPDALRGQLSGLQQQLARTQYALERNPFAVQGPQLGDNLTGLRRQLTEINTLINRSDAHAGAAALAGRVASLDEQLARTENTLQETYTALRPAAVDWQMSGLQRQLARTQPLLGQDYTKVQPLAIHAQMSQLHSRLDRIQQSLARPTPEWAATTDLQSGIAGLQQSLNRTQTLLDQGQWRSQPAAMKEQMSGLNQQFGSIQHSLAMSRSVLQPLVLQTQANSLTQRLDRLGRLPESGQSALQTTALRDNMAKLQITALRDPSAVKSPKVSESLLSLHHGLANNLHRLDQRLSSAHAQDLAPQMRVIAVYDGLAAEHLQSSRAAFRVCFTELQGSYEKPQRNGTLLIRFHSQQISSSPSADFRTLVFEHSNQFVCKLGGFGRDMVEHRGSLNPNHLIIVFQALNQWGDSCLFFAGDFRQVRQGQHPRFGRGILVVLAQCRDGPLVPSGFPQGPTDVSSGFPVDLAEQFFKRGNSILGCRSYPSQTKCGARPQIVVLLLKHGHQRKHGRLSFWSDVSQCGGSGSAQLAVFVFQHIAEVRNRLSQVIL
ncbi:MAG: hypothetical protein ABIP48_15735 [Planctomycetota bacterium]